MFLDALDGLVGSRLVGDDLDTIENVLDACVFILRVTFDGDPRRRTFARCAVVRRVALFNAGHMKGDLLVLLAHGCGEREEND